MSEPKRNDEYRNSDQAEVYAKMFSVERLKPFVEKHIESSGGFNKETFSNIIDAIYTDSFFIFPRHQVEYRAFCDSLKEKTFSDQENFIETLGYELARFAQEHTSVEDLEVDMGRAVVEQNQYSSLNEMISYGIYREDLHLHVAPAYSKTGKEKIRLVEEAFRELAQRLKDDPSLKDVKIISATSWIVAKQPMLMKRLGFTTLSDINEDSLQENFPGQRRDSDRAVIKVEDFIKKWS